MLPRIATPVFAHARRELLTAAQAVRGLLAGLVFACALFVVLPAASVADTTICSTGTGAGKCGASGIAVDEETGRLYVSDEANHRVDVFSSSGAFEMAFGWGVGDGASELEVCTTSCREGIPGSGAGQLARPTSIAVDNIPGSLSRHDIYVVDLASKRIEKFDPEGHFILAFGEPGEGEGQFSSAFARGINVGVGPSGMVYVADTLGKVESDGEVLVSKARLQRFSESGALLAPGKVLFEGPHEGGKPDALAVRPTGSFYVSSESAGVPSIREFAEDGAPLGIAAEEVGSALSVDSSGHLFSAGNTEEYGLPGPLEASSTRQEVAEFDESDSLIRKFAYGTFTANEQPGGVAGSSSASEAYVIDGDRVVRVPFPSPGPLVIPEKCIAQGIGNTSATLDSEINPEGQATTYHYELVADAQFQHDVQELGAGHGFDHATRAPANETDDPSLASGFVLKEAPLVAQLAPETRYHCRVVAKNSEGETTGQEGELASKEPFEFGPIFASTVGADTAVLQAEGNPLGIPSTGQFEYVDDATFQESGFANAKLAPATPFSFGEGTATVRKEAEITGLLSDTVYHFRLRASDHFLPAGVACPRQEPTCPEHEPTFQTFAMPFSGLPDGRAWELVSPNEKNGAEVAVPGPAGGLSDTKEVVPRIQAAAESGEAVTYTSWTSFGPASGAPGASQYLSRRTAEGWVTENISPAGLQDEGLNPPFRGFSPDLRFAALLNLEPPLTANAQPGFENMYLRDNTLGGLMALTKEPITFTQGAAAGFPRRFCTTYAGVTADGSHAFFSADGALGSAPNGEGISLYEWSPTASLSLVSVLPNGTLAPPADRTHFGGEANLCAADQGVIRHAVSSDGSVVFWTYGGTYEGSPEPLFARINGTETVQLDAQAGGSGPSGKGRFWAATADGSRAFFTAPGRLTSNAHAAGQLYMYDTNTRSTTDLTPGVLAPEIRGVIGASADGTTVYFVGSGALTGTQQNDAGQQAKAGAHNLYSWHEGEGLRFIAVLSGLDDSDWGSKSASPSALTAGLTPDGGHLAFESMEAESLSGYDNLKFPAGGCQPKVGGSLEGDPHCSEVYLYDAETHGLTCVSCNPSGARPSGPAALPPWTNPFEGPRYLAEGGSRVFFESPDSLEAADQNGKRDVYEFERLGSHSCVPEASAFIPKMGGCLSLISSGNSSDESYFVDASADGRDVFFTTRSPLVGWDRNADFDIYDAREGGGFPEPPPTPQPCEGEGCRSTSIAPPVFGAALSATFSGAGNFAPPPAKPLLKPKSLTRAEKLAKALEACRQKHNKQKRASCERSARKKYHAKAAKRSGMR